MASGNELVSTSGTYGNLFLPVALPNGRLLKNRLVKVAMYEHLANLFGGPPNRYHYNLYTLWAQYGWSMLITGNIQVSSDHCTLGRDMVIPVKITPQSLEPFRQLGSCMKLDPTTGKPSGCLAIMQLNHAGRQSANILGGRFPFDPPLAPSPIPVRSRNGTTLSKAIHAVLFQKPREMTLQDIDEVLASFVKGAKVAMDSGFDGIQLHAAHGYLLAQFISPKSNVRLDQYSAEPKNALRLLHRIVKEIRAVVPSSFIVGVKVNAADYIDVKSLESSHQDEDRALGHISAMAGWGGIDFIEISGGDYERPDFMMSQNKSSQSHRQAFFSRLSHKALHSLKPLLEVNSGPRPPLILLTGGLRTPGHLQDALGSGDADLLGIGRGSVLCPNLPEILRQHELGDIKRKDMPFAPEPDLSMLASFKRWPISWIWERCPKIPLIGAGAEMAWYLVAMRRIALCRRAADKVNIGNNTGIFSAVLWMWVWTPSIEVPGITRTSGVALSIILILTFASFLS